MSDVADERTGDIQIEEQLDEQAPEALVERTLPLVVIAGVVIMPRIPVPLQIGTGKSYRAMEEAMEGDRDIRPLLIRHAEGAR